MKQPIKRLPALLLTAVWVLGAALPALAEETGTANGEIISIATTADLLALQNRCIVDTATQNLTVQLQADLDLSGCAFTGLPVFSGHFDGQGHTISGLALADGSSVQGFFRYLEATAVVEDLHLQGSVGGSDATVQGLLAGENRGLVRGCSASGQAEAGGLVGRNESSGQIVNCRSTATVQADRMAGGMVSWADDGIAAVNSTASRFSWAIDQLGPVLDSVGTALAQADAAGAALEQLLQDASLAAGWSEDAKAQWQTAVEAFAAARSRARDALEQAHAALQALQAALGDDEASSAAWARLAEALNTLQTAAGQVQDAADTLEELFDKLGSATEPADRPQELENLYQALLSCQQARNTMLEARDAIRSQLESDAPDPNTLLTAAEDGLQAAAQAASATQELLTALDSRQPYTRRDRSLARPDRSPANRDGSVSHCVGTGTRRRQSSARSDTRVRERDICRLG